MVKKKSGLLKRGGLKPSEALCKRLSNPSNKALLRKIKEILSKLTVREMEVINGAYGLGKGYILTPTERRRIIRAKKARQALLRQ